MASIKSRFEKIQDTVSNKKAEKKHAERKLEEINEKLIAIGIKPENLDSEITKIQKEMEVMDKEIQKRLKEAENTLGI